MKFNFLNFEKLKNFIGADSKLKLPILQVVLEKLDFPQKDVNVIFVSEVQIKKLNKEWRGKDVVTDVLSFNINEADLLGELYISLDYIKKNYKKFEDNFETEFIRLLVHGTLHLLGYDHKLEFIGGGNTKRSEHIDTDNLEEMFILQEKHLGEVLKLVQLEK